MLQNRLLVQSYIWRHVKLWLLVRALVGALVLSAAVSAHTRLNPLAMPLTGVGVLVLSSASVNVLEMSRRHEFDFLGNLGVTRGTIATWVLLPPLVGETVLLVFRP